MSLNIFRLKRFVAVFLAAAAVLACAWTAFANDNYETSYFIDRYVETATKVDVNPEPGNEFMLYVERRVPDVVDGNIVLQIDGAEISDVIFLSDCLIAGETDVAGGKITIPVTKDPAAKIENSNYYIVIPMIVVPDSGNGDEPFSFQLSAGYNGITDYFGINMDPVIPKETYEVIFDFTGYQLDEEGKYVPVPVPNQDGNTSIRQVIEVDAGNYAYITLPEADGLKIPLQDGDGHPFERWESPSGQQLDPGTKYNLSVDGTKTATFRSLYNNRIKNTIVCDFSKTDESGEPVNGARLLLTNADTMETIDQWTTGGIAYRLELPPGNYCLEETYVPEGYRKAENLIFSITADDVLFARLNTVGGGE